LDIERLGEEKRGGLMIVDFGFLIFEGKRKRGAA